MLKILWWIIQVRLYWNTTPCLPLTNNILYLARTSTVILENFYVQVANFYKNPSYKLAKSFSKSNGLWVCEVSVNWPTQQRFEAHESKKTEAAKVASTVAIEWLRVYFWFFFCVDHLFCVTEVTCFSEFK